MDCHFSLALMINIAIIMSTKKKKKKEIKCLSVSVGSKIAVALVPSIHTAAVFTSVAAILLRAVSVGR